MGPINAFPVPDDSISIAAGIRGVLAVVGFFLPGYLVFRRWSGSERWIIAFLGSTLFLFWTVLGLDAVGLPINLLSLSLGLTLFTAIGLALGRPAISPANHTAHEAKGTGRSWLWLIPCLVAGISTLARALMEPLAGFDNLFRWDHLAQIIVTNGSLSAYPPVTANDFRVYPWCDGIPPLVSLTNAWIYLAAGSSHGALIAVRLLAEFALTFYLTWRLARELWDKNAGYLAAAALATSSLFLWSLQLEQETGLTGIGLLAMALFGLQMSREPSRTNVVWFALASSWVALCRDYNLIYVAMAVGFLLMHRGTRPHWRLALGLIALIACPWYARNAWVTGNPFFAHRLGDLFPTNPIHEQEMESFRHFWALARQPWEKIISTLAIGIGSIVAIGLAGLWALRGRQWWVVALASVTALIWIASMPSTAGGPFYALRVVGPAVPLIAALCGYWETRRLGAGRYVLMAVVALGSIDAARRCWIYLWSPREAPWHYSWQRWRDVREVMITAEHDPLWSRIAKSAGGEAVLLDHSGYFVFAGRAGAHVIPLFSPEASALTAPASTPVDLRQIAQTLRRQGIRFVILTDDEAQNREFILANAGLSALFRQSSVMRIGNLCIYDLVALARP